MRYYSSPARNRRNKWRLCCHTLRASIRTLISVSCSAPVTGNPQGPQSLPLVRIDELQDVALSNTMLEDINSDTAFERPLYEPRCSALLSVDNRGLCRAGTLSNQATEATDNNLRDCHLSCGHPLPDFPDIGQRSDKGGIFDPAQPSEIMCEQDVANTPASGANNSKPASVLLPDSPAPSSSYLVPGSENCVRCPNTTRLFNAWFDSVQNSCTNFGKFVKRFCENAIPRCGGRWRDVLPIPPFDGAQLHWKTSLDAATGAAVTRGVQFCAAGLNWMGGHKLTHRMPRALHKQHVFILDRLLENLIVVFVHLEREGKEPRINGGFLRFTAKSTTERYPDLCADLVDIPAHCALVDPMRFVGQEHADILNNEDEFFPNGLGGCPRRVEFKSGDRCEYITLIIRELRAGKTGLCLRPLASGDLFAVPKRGGAKQRVIWHGGRVSELCRKPPVPPYLANPCALGNLESSKDRPLWASGRDAWSWFDQLALSPSLQKYTGRPRISLQELLNWSSPDELPVTMDEIRGYVIDPDDKLSTPTIFSPVALVWPMGLSWSSFVAQSTLVGSALQANFRESQFLTDEGSLPEAEADSLSLATDDVVLFTRASPEECSERNGSDLQRLDRAWAEIGIQGQHEKFYEMQASTVSLGITLIDGIKLGPRFSTLWCLLEAMTDLNMNRSCSPANFTSALGSTQWLDLLNRPLLSCLHACYAFSRAEPQHEVQEIWSNALGEMQHNCSLCPLWIIDLCRPWSSQLFATDASPEFGFGVCRASLAPHLVREAASIAGKGPHHFNLIDRESDEIDKPRSGTKHVLPLRWRDFRVLISKKAKRLAHAGELEGEGAVIALKRISRDLRLHGHRTLVLMDAIAVLSALQRGRSSAPSLRMCVRRASAYTLASDLRLRFGYIPTTWNPADPPSRGKRFLRRHRCSTGGRTLASDRLIHRLTVAGRKLAHPTYTESLSARASTSTTIF